MPESRIESIVKHYKRGVCKITAQNCEISAAEPFTTTTDEMVCGSGFLIPWRYLYLPEKTDEGERCFYFVTNAHVIKDAQNVMLQLLVFGEQQFEARTVSVCTKFDLALLVLTDPDGFTKLLKGKGIA